MNTLNLKSLCLTLVMTLIGSSQAFAEEYLNAKQIADLITGNTVYVKHLIKGFKFRVYFDPDGSTAHRLQDGKTTETTYQFYGDEHCLRWGGKDRCANILDNKDGTYTRVKKNGKHILMWTKIVKGKDL